MSNRPLPRRRCALRLVSAYQLYRSGGYAWHWAILDRGLVAPAGDSNSSELLQTVASSAGKSQRKTASELIKQTPGLAKYLAAFAPLEARTRKLSAMLVG